MVAVDQQGDVHIGVPQGLCNDVGVDALIQPSLGNAMTERVPNVGGTLVRAGKTWIVAGVTEAVDGHRVVSMAAVPATRK